MTTNEQEIWSIGHYCGDSSICVNLTFRGKTYHRSDYGHSIIPRFIRLGWAIASLEKESGLLQQRHEILARAGWLMPNEKRATADSRREPRQRNEKRQRRLAPATSMRRQSSGLRHYFATHDFISRRLIVWQDGKGSRFHPNSLLPAVHDWIRVLPKGVGGLSG